MLCPENFDGYSYDGILTSVNCILASPAPDCFYTEETVIDIVDYDLKIMGEGRERKRTYSEILLKRQYAYPVPEPPQCIRAQYDCVNMVHNRDKEVCNYTYDDLDDQTKMLIKTMTGQKYAELYARKQAKRERDGFDRTRDSLETRLAINKEIEQEMRDYGDFTEKFIQRKNIRINWPKNPYSRNFRSLVQISYSKKVTIPRSINSIVLDHRQQGGQLLVAGRLEKSAYGDHVKAFNTTLLPNIPGLLPLLTLVFAPKIEFRVRKTKKMHNSYYFSGMLAGMGFIEGSGEDLEKTDSTLKVDDNKNDNNLNSELRNQIENSYSDDPTNRLIYKSSSRKIVDGFFPEDDIEINCNSLYFDARDIDIANEIRQVINTLAIGCDDPKKLNEGLEKSYNEKIDNDINSGDFQDIFIDTRHEQGKSRNSKNYIPNFESQPRIKLTGQNDIKRLHTKQSIIRRKLFKLLKRSRPKLAEYNAQSNEGGSEDFEYPYLWSQKKNGNRNLYQGQYEDVNGVFRMYEYHDLEEPVGMHSAFPDIGVVKKKKKGRRSTTTTMYSDSQTEADLASEYSHKN